MKKINEFKSISTTRETKIENAKKNWESVIKSGVVEQDENGNWILKKEIRLKFEKEQEKWW